MTEQEHDRIEVMDEELNLKEKRQRIEDENASRDAQRNMAWFSLSGMVFYPLAIVAASFFGLDKAAALLSDIAPTYFVSVAGVVAVFFGKSAYEGKNQ